MFVKAYRVAAQWTRPVVVLERGPDGAVGTGCGTFIILNSEGWVATAAHVLFARPDARLTDRCVWFTTDAIKGNFHIDLRADLAIGKLSGLDLSGIREYPKFGNGELTPGTSLSHWGFHSHATIKAAFDAQTRQFRVDSFPLIPLPPVSVLAPTCPDVPPTTPPGAIPNAAFTERITPDAPLVESLRVSPATDWKDSQGQIDECLRPVGLQREKTKRSLPGLLSGREPLRRQTQSLTLPTQRRWERQAAMGRSETLGGEACL